MGRWRLPGTIVFYRQLLWENTPATAISNIAYTRAHTFLCFVYAPIYLRTEKEKKNIANERMSFRWCCLWLVKTVYSSVCTNTKLSLWFCRRRRSHQRRTNTSAAETHSSHFIRCLHSVPLAYSLSPLKSPFLCLSRFLPLSLSLSLWSDLSRYHGNIRRFGSFPWEMSESTFRPGYNTVIHRSHTFPPAGHTSARH